MSDVNVGLTLVDGATGYVGTHLISKLQSVGTDVRALVHPGIKTTDAEFLQKHTTNIFTADLSKTGSDLDAPFKEVRNVVHLIGSVAPKKGERLEDLHVTQTRNLVKAAQAAGVKRIVMVSSLGARHDANNAYHATKCAAEELIRTSGIDFVIIRAPLIIGNLVGSRDSKLVKRYREIILTKKMVPLLNGGMNKLQPIFIGDLVEAICLALADENPACINKTIEVGGPEVMTMRSFVESLMQSLDVRKPIFALHPVLASGVAAIMQAVQDVPALSPDQVKLSMQDNVCTDNALTTLFKMSPTPLNKALESYNTQSAEMAFSAGRS